MPGVTEGAFPLPVLEAALKAGGIRLPPGAAEALARHAGEMLRWNPSIRLTAITDPREVAVKHVLDSLLLLRFPPAPSGGRLPEPCLPLLRSRSSGRAGLSPEYPPRRWPTSLIERLRSFGLVGRRRRRYDRRGS